MRVLILAYDFPPYVSVGGLRPWSWFRYLADFGVRPVVVTRQWANRYGDERDYVAPGASDAVEIEELEHGTLIRTPYRPNLSHRLLLRHGPDRYRLLRKLVTGAYEVGQHFAAVGPKVQLYHAARRYIREHGVDAIVATGEPFVLFRYASLLSREFGVPWVADFRDPWSQNLNRSTGPVARRWARALEVRDTASASAVVTVGDAFRDQLAELHAGKAITVIPNGYDPEAMDAARDVPQGSESLTLAVTGSISGWRPVESVFRVLDAFVRERPEVPLRLEMIGVGRREYLESFLRTDFSTLASRVTFTGRLPNREMAMALARANAFLLFNNYAYPGTQIYDYLALRRRILLCYADDAEAMALKRKHYNLALQPGTDERVQERILRATRAGMAVQDANHLRGVMNDLADEFALEGRIACDSQDTERYSRRARAGELATLLRGLVSREAP